MSTRYKFQIKPIDQKYMGDTAFLGAQLLRDTKKLSYVINRFSDDRFVSFLSQFGVSTGEAGAIGAESGTIGESLIRWRIRDNTMKATKIVDGVLPNQIKANVPFTVYLDENWVDTSGIYMAEDMRSTFFVNKRGIGVGPSFEYAISFVSGVKDEVFTRRDLLAPGRYLNYIGNAKPELSTTSQSIKFDAGGYDMFNVTQVLRHKYAVSGHFISTKMVQMDAYDGNMMFDPANSGYLPFDGSEMLKFHLRSVGTTLYYGRTNFDPLNRRVLTVDPDTGRPEVPMTAGALQQMQWTESQAEYDPTAPTVTLKNIIDGHIASRSDYFRDPDTVYLIITGNGGDKVLDNIKQIKHTSQVTLQQNVDGGQKIQNVGLNYQNATYWTSNGSFTVLNTEYTTRPRGFQAERVMWNGAPYDKDGFDMYIIPIAKMADGRRTVRLATKSANGVNRGLVIGSLAGMTGMHNGGNLDLNSITGKDFAQSVMFQDRHKIASPVDGETFLTLSELCVVVEDPDSILWLRAKFPN